MLIGISASKNLHIVLRSTVGLPSRAEFRGAHYFCRLWHFAAEFLNRFGAGRRAWRVGERTFATCTHDILPADACVFAKKSLSSQSNIVT